MTVENISRRAGPFVGDGTVTAFPFEFKIFDTSQLSVQRTNAEGGVDVLRLSEDYTVALNADQDENPGGTVNVLTPLAQALRLAIISAIPSDQTVKVTNYDRFYPKTFNDVFDKLTGLIQQLEENLSRAVTVDATDELTPAELKLKLLDAAANAYEVAKGFADLAQQYAEAAKESEVKTAEYAEAATIIKPYTDQITKTADAIESVKSVGDAIDSVKTVSQEIETVKKVGEGMDDVRKAAELQPHIDDIKTAGEHVDEIHKVGQDLQGVEASDFDCGEIGDPIDPIVTVEGGYIKKVAEHIDDCIHPVGDSLEDIKKVASNLDAVNETAELARIDYEKMFKEGL